MRNSRSRLVVAAATFLSLSLLTAACGVDATAPEPPPAVPVAPESAPAAPVDGGFPQSVDAYGVRVTVPARPERIVSLSPASTEGLFAVGAGAQVVAVDEYSDFPAEAPTTTLSGFTPNLEAIVAYDPDLVIVSYDPGDLVAGLEAAGITVLTLPAAVTFDDVYTQLELLGAITGNDEAATELVASLEARVAAVVDGLPALERPLTYFHELDDTLYTVTSATFVGAVYALLGLENIADAADADGASFGYPQLSAEFLLAADPDLVFLADTRCCATDASTFAARPGFAALRAVRSGDVIELDDDVASRWGPRIVDFLEQAAAAVAQVAARVG
jgi:iron complex transport system substrate-binding protein